MRRVLVTVASGLALTALAPAQQQLVRELEAKLTNVSVGSVAWFHASLDRVAALANVDYRLAVQAGEELWQRAASDGPSGVAEAAAAWVACALKHCEGPTSSATWELRAKEPPADAAPWVLADYYLTRARDLCLLGRHSEELPLAIKGRMSAEAAGDWARRLEASLTIRRAVPSRGIHDLRRQLAVARAAGSAEQIRYVEPLIALAEAEHCLDRGEVAETKKRLEVAQAMAAAVGHQQVLVAIQFVRAGIADREEQYDLAALELSFLEPLCDECGDTRGKVIAVDLRAELAIRVGDLEGARALIAAELELMKGRGWLLLERSVLITKFNLAVKDHDGALADELSGQIDSNDDEGDRDREQYLDISEQLVAAELERAEFERQLTAGRLQWAEQAQAIWMWSGIAGVIGLGFLLSVSWLARRRLVRVNLLLAEKVQQVEQERSAKSHLEERMRQMQRAEGLGTLAAGIAHDFNNLLTSMIGGAELLRIQTGDQDRHQLTEMILSAGQQGARLCRQLQAYSGGSPLQLEAHDLLRIVQDTLPTLHASVKGQLQVLVAPESESAVAMVDRGQMEQVLLNLVLNSHEAAAKCVRITIRTADLPDEVEGEEPAQRVAILELVDDGSGMTEEVAQRIFDPFFTTKFPGRGLGLAVVFGGVRRHGGQVAVDVLTSGGSRFVIQLPLAGGDVLIPLPPKQAIADVRDVSMATEVAVIIVDDEAIVRKALSSMLLKIGVKAQAFERGEDAIRHVQALSDQQACIALVDWTMPGMDGAEVIRLLRDTGKRVRCVLMSGHARDYVEDYARQLAPERLLAKPFLLDDVRAALQELSDEMQLLR